MFEWENPEKVENFTQYYLYLLFSKSGRIGRADFARGFFFGYLSFIFVSAILYVIFVEFFFNNWDSLLMFGVNTVLILSFTFGILLVSLLLPYKRLLDTGFDEGWASFTVLLGWFGALLFLMGPFVLFFYCLIAGGQKLGNPNGKPCTIYNDIKQRRYNLVNAAEKCLGRNDFIGAIRNYEELKDRKLVFQAKKSHLSHGYDLLNTQMSRMLDKGVRCDKLVKRTNDLTGLVNNYLGFSSSESTSTPQDNE